MTVRSQVEIGVKLISDWKHNLPAIVVFDLLARTPDDTDPTARFLLGEVVEAHEEASRTGAEYDPKKEAIELIDCLVFLVSHSIAHGIQIDIAHLIAQSVSLNGFGKSEAVYERLRARVESMMEGNRAENIHSIFALIVTRLRTLTGIDILHITRLTLQKNRKNRDTAYYDDDLDGETLSFEELILRYYHSEKLLRMLRKEFGSPLPSWAHLPLRPHILDFKHPELSEGLVLQGMHIMKIVLADIALRPLPREEYIRSRAIDELPIPNETIISLLDIFIAAGAINPKTGRLQSAALEYGLRAAGAISIEKSKR